MLLNHVVRVCFKASTFKVNILDDILLHDFHTKIKKESNTHLPVRIFVQTLQILFDSLSNGDFFCWPPKVVPYTKFLCLEKLHNLMSSLLSNVVGAIFYL